MAKPRKEISGFWGAVLVGLTCPLCSPDELLDQMSPSVNLVGLQGQCLSQKGGASVPVAPRKPPPPAPVPGQTAVASRELFSNGFYEDTDFVIKLPKMPVVR